MALRKYDREEVAEVVFSGMRGGLSAFKAVQAAGVPWGTWQEWVAESEDLSVRYARARDCLVERMSAELLEITDAPLELTGDGKIDSAAVQSRRLQVDTRKWLLSKLAPRRYGERLELAGDKESPLRAEVAIAFRKTE